MTFQPPNTSQLQAFKLDLSKGTLSSPSTIAVPLSFGLAVDPASKFLYLSDPNLVTPAIDIFAIDPKSGSLTQDGAFLLTTICVLCPPPSGPGALAMDSKGKFLFYGSVTFGNGVAEGIGALTITSGTGTLNQVPGSPFVADQVPFEVLVHPTGSFFYTENTTNPPVFPLSLESVSGFSIDPGTGVLIELPQSPFSIPATANISGFASHPSGKFLYATTGPAANGILGWSVDGGTGALTVLPTSPFASGTASGGVAIDPLGKFLYASNESGGGILGFSVDAASGALTPLSNSPFDASVVLVQPTIDPSGKFLVAVDATQHAITLFTIDSAGALTQMGNSTPLSGTPFTIVMAKAP